VLYLQGFAVSEIQGDCRFKTMTGDIRSLFWWGQDLEQDIVKAESKMSQLILPLLLALKGDELG
jgi:hypothetical protein